MPDPDAPTSVQFSAMDAGGAAGDLDAGYEDWQLVGSYYFSKRELYPLGWSRGPRGAPGVNLEYMR